MSILQIRDFPPDAKHNLEVIARSQGQSLSALVRQVLQREVALPRNRVLVDQARAVAMSGSSRFVLEDVLTARDAERK